MREYFHLQRLEKSKPNLFFKWSFQPKEESDTIRKFAPEKNEENLDKLEAELEKINS
jgi:hypothetical protein